MQNTPRIIAALLATAALAACGPAVQQTSRAGIQAGVPGTASLTPAQQAAADSGRMAYTRADVHFMQGMIGHHAQAVVMAGWAPSHGASASVQTLAARIDVSQRDEIAFMQRWLRDRHETVPEPASLRDSAAHDMSMPGMDMPGMATPALMPGMLTPAQMAQLDSARGTDFDRLFLTFMIQHHQGALTMVNQLFASPGAGQELYVFKFASDVNADQQTEIDRMSRMLAALPSDARP